MLKQECKQPGVPWHRARHSSKAGHELAVSAGGQPVELQKRKHAALPLQRATHCS
jgi:hypothetical protein